MKRKLGGGGGSVSGICEVLKCVVFAHLDATFFPLFLKFGGPQKVGGINIENYSKSLIGTFELLKKKVLYRLYENIIIYNDCSEGLQRKLAFVQLQLLLG